MTSTMDKSRRTWSIGLRSISKRSPFLSPLFLSDSCEWLLGSSSELVFNDGHGQPGGFFNETLTLFNDVLFLKDALAF